MCGDIAARGEHPSLDLLTRTSGKMLLLNKLLPKLKAEGHKVRDKPLTLNPKLKAEGHKVRDPRS